MKYIATTAALAAALLWTLPSAQATEPCGDFGECKVLIEINSSDGDIGFHFLMDGNDLNSGRILDPWYRTVFVDRARGPLRQQKLTETFAESAEPLCWEDPEADPEDLEDIVTLKQFLRRWKAGQYIFLGRSDRGEWSFGRTSLTYELPAAPIDLDFEDGVITWARAGDMYDPPRGDLGNCATAEELDELVAHGKLTVHPENVAVDEYEVVLEPDVDGPLSRLKFSIRVPGDAETLAVTVPEEYLASLPEDTPVKIEVGAIGGEDNATFTEEDGFCANEVEGCED